MAQSKPLTQEEHEILLPVLIKMLKQKSDETNPLVSDKIVRWFNENKEKVGYKSSFTKQRFMKLINHIRTNHLLPILSGDKGYYLSSDPNTIDQIVVSLESRIISQQQAVEGLKFMAARLRAQRGISKVETCPLGFKWDY